METIKRKYCQHLNALTHKYQLIYDVWTIMLGMCAVISFVKSLRAISEKRMRTNNFIDILM